MLSGWCKRHSGSTSSCTLLDHWRDCGGLACGTGMTEACQWRWVRGVDIGTGGWAEWREDGAFGGGERWPQAWVTCTGCCLLVMSPWTWLFSWCRPKETYCWVQGLWGPNLPIMAPACTANNAAGFGMATCCGRENYWAVIGLIKMEAHFAAHQFLQEACLWAVYSSSFKG